MCLCVIVHAVQDKNSMFYEQSEGIFLVLSSSQVCEELGHKVFTNIVGWMCVCVSWIEKPSDNLKTKYIFEHLKMTILRMF